MNTEKSDEAFWSSNSDLDVFKNICFVDEFLFGDITSYSYLTNGNVEVAGIDDRSDLKDTLVSKQM